MQAHYLLSHFSIIQDNLAGIRHIAFNLLNSQKTVKAGMKRKQKKAAMNTDYLSELLMAKGFS